MIMLRYGISNISELSKRQWEEIAPEIRIIHKNCDRPRFKKISDLDGM